MSDREVKTSRMLGEVWSEQFDADPTLSPKGFEAGWHAALASVILPEGRFEVGQSCEVFDHHNQKWLKGRFGATDSLDDGTDVTFWDDPTDVRPLPKTVELTVNEKIREVATAMLNKIKPATSGAMVHEIIGVHIEISQALANGKTLDQLCSEFGVSTTEELS